MNVHRKTPLFYASCAPASTVSSRECCRNLFSICFLLCSPLWHNSYPTCGPLTSCNFVETFTHSQTPCMYRYTKYISYSVQSYYGNKVSSGIFGRPFSLVLSYLRGSCHSRMNDGRAFATTHDSLF